MTLEGATVRDASGRAVATWHAAGHRLDWDWAALGADAGLMAAGRAEAADFDAWAEGRRFEIDETPAAADAPGLYGLSGWRAARPPIAVAEEASGLGIELAGRRVLDIGGSAKNMVFWLPERPARIDHVDVSAGSQALALARLRKAHGATGTHVIFHTVPAEHMPFADGAFDLVFSWSSLHHCRRPRVFDEALRVLAPGGMLLVLDRYLSGPLRAAMLARRRALGLDRGTDDPVSRAEFQALAARMARAWWAPFGSDALVRYLAAKARGRPAPVGSPVGRAVPGRRGMAAVRDRWLGRDAVLIGVKAGGAAG